MDTQSLIERHKERLAAADRKLAALGMAFPMQGSNKTLLANARKAVQDTAEALASQAAEIERMMESLSEAIRLFKSKRLALNSQYEAVDVLREDGVYSIVIADLEEIRARAALNGEKP